MKVYLSGGITNVSNFEKVFETAGQNIKKNGIMAKEGFIPGRHIEVENPAKFPHDHDKNYWSYMRECVSHLALCKTIYMLKGWWKSKGARIELLIALLLRIPVEFER